MRGSLIAHSVDFLKVLNLTRLNKKELCKELWCYNLGNVIEKVDEIKEIYL